VLKEFYTKTPEGRAIIKVMRQEMRLAEKFTKKLLTLKRSEKKKIKRRR
jgi:hypothetical protein